MDDGKMVLGPLEGHTNRVWSVAFTPDGRTLASGSEDRTICIWDAKTGKPAMEPLMGHKDEVSSVAFTPPQFTHIFLAAIARGKH